MFLPVQIQVLLAWNHARRRIAELSRRTADDRGELTAGVIFLVALAVAAVGIAAVVIAKINDHANQIP